MRARMDITGIRYGKLVALSVDYFLRNHLRLGTNDENMQDKSKRHSFRATPEIISQIKSEFNKGLTRQQIADKFGFHRTYAGKILSGAARKFS